MKRTLSLFLALLLLFTAVSCTGTGKPAETAGDTAQTETEPPHSGISLAEFTIVRPDGQSSSSLIDAMKRIRTAIAAVTGTEPELGTDFVGKGKEPPVGTREILIGHTNRPESEKVYETLEKNRFSVSVENDRVVLAYIGTSAMEMCVDYFIREVLHYDEQAGTASVGQVCSGDIQPYAGQFVPAGIGKTLEGIFDGSTAEAMDMPGVGDGFWMHFGDFVWVGEQLYCYYISYAGTDGVGGVGLAISDDYGESFQSKGTVIFPGASYDGELCAFAGVWYEDGVFYVTYEACPNGGAADIALATSTDGIHFEKQGVILKKDKNSDWMNYNVGTPDLFKVGDTWYLTFHGFGSGKKDCQIGLAYGKDLFRLTVLKNPIIPTVEGTVRSGTTGRRDIIFVDGWYYMVFEISTNSGVDGVPYYDFGNSDWGHMFARSKDMKKWEVCDAPLYPTTGRGFGNDGPAWLVVEDDVYVCIRNDHNGTDRLKLTLGK